jgi:hypothetical protein
MVRGRPSSGHSPTPDRCWFVAISLQVTCLSWRSATRNASRARKLSPRMQQEADAASFLSLVAIAAGHRDTTLLRGELAVKRPRAFHIKSLGARSSCCSADQAPGGPNSRTRGGTRPSRAGRHRRTSGVPGAQGGDPRTPAAATCSRTQQLGELLAASNEACCSIEQTPLPVCPRRPRAGSPAWTRTHSLRNRLLYRLAAGTGGRA